MTRLASTRRLWTVARIFSGQQTKVEGGTYELYGANGVIGCTDQLQRGSVVLVGRVGSVGRVTVPVGQFGVSDNALVCAIDTAQLDRRWVAYWLSTLDWGPQLTGTAQPLLTGRLLAEQCLPSTELAEQVRIADYLDTETARIDRVMRANERMRQLASERFAAWQASVVAPWVDPIETLDTTSHAAAKAPAGWAVTRLASVGDAATGKVTVEQLAELSEVTHWTIEELAQSGKPRLQPGADIASDKLVVEGGELLVSRLNPRRGHVFRTFTSSQRSVASTEFFILKPRRLPLAWVWHSMRSVPVRAYLDANVRSATRSQQRVEMAYIARTPVLVPPRPELDARCRELEAELQSFERLLAVSEAQDRLLMERQQALITAAVTGELEV
ncbi:hypothetical protein [Egicoccus sp. AB-alg2]|uniref:hypothetical protein n=1 Tax=Egicoccus sp. AB-alg2 TaxID=3242693 RepID=UPI00359D2E67